MKENATSSNALENRIKCNEKGQSLDLNEWIFSDIELPPNSRVLELCCGTGKQTIEFVRRIGFKGHIFAIDISKESIQKLKGLLPDDKKSMVNAIGGEIEELASLAVKNRENSFDLAFCSYGLYYSKHPFRTLDEIKKLMKNNGKIIIVGPYGKNNETLFSFVEKRGVRIDKFVKYSSCDFMTDVVKWAMDNSKRITIRTVANNVIWKNSDDIITYWKNSTFYDSSKLSQVAKDMKDEIAKNGKFIVQKNISMIIVEI